MDKPQVRSLLRTHQQRWRGALPGGVPLTVVAAAACAAGLLTAAPASASHSAVSAVPLHLSGGELTRMAGLLDHTPGTSPLAGTPGVASTLPAARASGTDCHYTSAAAAQIGAPPKCEITGSEADPAAAARAAAGTQAPGTAPSVIASTQVSDVEDATQPSQQNVATLPLPGAAGSVIRIENDGDVALVNSSGLTQWDDQPESFASVWRVHPSSLNSLGDHVDTYPIIEFGPSPLIPSVTGGTPYAIGHVAGEKDPVVAVGDLFFPRGNNSMPAGQLSVPNSFVTVLDASTGAPLWYQEYPGNIEQLSIVSNGLIVGDSAGPSSLSSFPQSWVGGPGGPAGTVDVLDSWRFSPSASGLSAVRAWQYTMHAPNALWLSLAQAGPGNLAVGWSDTPIGAPAVPDGHVVLLSLASGQVQWNVATSGYPLALTFDPSRDQIVMAEQSDPAVALNYSIVGLQVSSGATAEHVALRNTTPYANLQVGNLTGSGGLDDWVIGEQPWVECPPILGGGTCPGHPDVAAFDPNAGKTLWRVTMPHPGAVISGFQPYGLALTTGLAGPEVVVGAMDSLTSPGPATPLGDLDLLGDGYSAYSDLMALSGPDGHLLWSDRGGDEVGPPYITVSRYQGQPAIYSINIEQDLHIFAASTGSLLDSQAMLAGGIWTAATAPGSHVQQVIVGGESGGVFGLSITGLSTKPQVLWRTSLSGPIQQIQVATLTPGGPPSLVVAATSELAVLTLDGTVEYQVKFPGQFVWNAAVGTINGQTAIVVPTNALTAFNAQTGRRLWQYKPDSGTAEFSNAGISPAGTVVSMYAVPPGFQPPGNATDQTAIGITLATGKVAWTQTAANPAGSFTSPNPDGGVLVSPDIPGANGNGVALAWNEGPSPFLGDVEVDVRDADTGALDYTQNIGQGNLPDLIAGPGFGLAACIGIAFVSQTLADIQPSGVTLQNAGPCYGAAAVTLPGGGSDVLLPDFGAMVVCSAGFPQSGTGLVEVADPEHDLQLLGVTAVSQPGVAVGLNFNLMAPTDLNYPMNNFGQVLYGDNTPVGFTMYSLPASAGAASGSPVSGR